MTAERSAVHASFTIERRYDAPQALVFGAWADPAAKARWFGGGTEWQPIRREQDFRVGGREHASGRWATGVATAFDALYHDIQSDRRIVYSYDMHLDGKHISVSLATVEFLADGAGTLLVFTEQVANLDGFSDPDARGREQGTRGLLDRLEQALR